MTTPHKLPSSLASRIKGATPSQEDKKHVAALMENAAVSSMAVPPGPMMPPHEQPETGGQGNQVKAKRTKSGGTRKKEPTEWTVAFAMRLPASVRDDIVELAATRLTTPSRLAREAIEQYVAASRKGLK